MRVSEVVQLYMIWRSRQRMRRDKKACQRRYWVHETIQGREALGEFHRLVSELRLDGERFHRYFRVSIQQFDELLRLVGPLIQKKNTNFRSAMSPAQRLAVTLR